MIPIPEKRITDFENMAFGIYVHWGLYSQLGKGEWIQNIAGIPQEEYSKLADTFTASKFTGRNLARVAKRAGAKYMTLTTRHHDGFSLYDTKGLNTYDAPHSAAGRDLIAEFVEGCRAEGIMPFFYHTTFDWKDDFFKNDFEGYHEYFRKSIEILCTNYGKIGGFEFDGVWRRKDVDWKMNEIYATIRKYQPDAIIINNTGMGDRGKLGDIEVDSVTFEQGHPEPMNREGMAKYVTAEMCETLNRHWGIGFGDFNYKSLPYLIETLCHCRKVGANYLLNIGPDAEGGVVPLQEELLAGVGDWIRTVGYSSIYEGRPCEIKGKGKNFALKANGKYYLYVHQLAIKGLAAVTVEEQEAGNGPKSFSGLDRKIKSVKWVDNGEELEVTQNLADKSFVVNCTGYDYGTNYIVRVAEVEVE